MAPKMVWEDAEPIKATPNHKVWQELERLVDEGLVKNIGVSNCTIPMLIDIWSYARHKPVINQVEAHPYFQQKDFKAFHDRLGVKLQAYAPLGSNHWGLRSDDLKSLNLFEEPVIKELSEKYQKSASAIILNWHLHRGHMVIPKTTKIERLTPNFQVFDFTLSEEDYERINGLERGARFYNPKYYKEYGWNNAPYFD